MIVKHEYDQAPRYGWASVSIGGRREALVVVHTDSGSFGFKYRAEDNTMEPTCICGAYCPSECSCPNVDWGYE